jgi:hypothetical protein
MKRKFATALRTATMTAMTLAQVWPSSRPIPAATTMMPRIR